MLKYFLKFGQKEHLIDLVNGGLYFSNAQKYWDIEEQGLKGQCDLLEASGKFLSQKLTLNNEQTGDGITLEVPISSIVHYDPLKRIPVFCLTVVNENECTEDGRIVFDLKRRTEMSQHFPKADSVVIINKPEQFIVDVAKTINCKMIHKKIEYFNIIEGIEIPGGERVMDINYLEYMIRDIDPIYEENLYSTITGEKKKGKLYAITVNDAVRNLFCKDVFYKCENEYRLALPEEKIEEGKLYQCNISEELKLLPIEDFYEEYCV